MRLLLGIENSLGILGRVPTNDDYKLIIANIAEILETSWCIPIQWHNAQDLVNVDSYRTATIDRMIRLDMRPLWGIINDIASNGYEICIVGQIDGAIILETQPIRLLVSTDALNRHHSIINDLNSAGVGFENVLSIVQQPLFTQLKKNVNTDRLPLSRLREIIHSQINDRANIIAFEHGMVNKYALIDALLSDLLVLIRDLYHDLYLANVVNRLGQTKELNLSLTEQGVYVNVYKH